MELALETLQVALGTRTSLSNSPSEKDWYRLYSFAKAHSIIGLVFGGIERLPKDCLPNINLLMEWIGQAEYIKTQKVVFDGVLAEFDSLMQMYDVSYVVFKGAAVASHYPVPALRTMGDIDFYVPPMDFDRAVKVIRRELKVDVSQDKVDKHFQFTWMGLIFEMHYQMETFGCKRHQEFFGKLCDSCFTSNLESFGANEAYIPMYPPLVDFVEVMKHWFTHLIGEGVGLRQTTDLAVLINAYRDQIEVKALKECLLNIGYLGAMDAVVALVGKYYGIEWPSYWNQNGALSYEDAHVYADKIMEDVIRNGNFGQSDYKHKAGKMKRLETSYKFFHHCLRYYRLAPRDIRSLIPKRVMISIKAH